jgi:hypothetical protein
VSEPKTPGFKGFKFGVYTKIIQSKELVYVLFKPSNLEKSHPVDLAKEDKGEI